MKEFLLLKNLIATRKNKKNEKLILLAIGTFFPLFDYIFGTWRHHLSFLKAGYIGLPYCFPYIFKIGILQGILFLIFFLGLIVVLFTKGLNLRKKILGKVFVSTSLFLWFLLGFICLGIHM